MVFFRGLGLDLVAGLEGTFQLRGLVHMQANFFAGHLLHHVKLPVNLQQVPAVRSGIQRALAPFRR